MSDDQTRPPHGGPEPWDAAPPEHDPAQDPAPEPAPEQEPLLPAADDEPDSREQPVVGGSRKKKRGPAGCLAVIIALAVLAGGFYVVVTKGVDFLSDQFSSAEDFSGPGKGEVSFEVAEGDTIADMGRSLKEAGVVASVQSFIDAAAAEPDANSIQVGFYALQEEMPAADALAVLLDPANQVRSTVTIPEGLRVVDVVDILVEKTPFKRGAIQKALDDPAALGLPDYAEGNPEGYLFPATYEVPPNATAKSLLASMVARWRQAADQVGLEDAASALGRTPAELMTIASLVEAEGRGDDMPKIARVIFNRLDNPDNGVTNGLLQIDASVNYGQDKTLGAVPTTEDIEADTPYNTYTRPGLPPTPIEAPGDDALAAAAAPAEGDWLFYVTVDLATGETKFTDDYDEFLTFKAELQDYCANESEAC